MKIRLRGLLQGDGAIWTIYIALCLVSLVEVYSATSSLSYKSGDYLAPIMSHAGYLVLGFLITWFFHNIPCRYFRAMPLPLILLSIIFLLLTYVIGSSVNETTRTIPVFGFNLQPSEFAKIGVISVTALVLSNSQREKSAAPNTMKAILAFVSGPIILIAPENLSTAVILGGVVTMMMIIGRVKTVQILKLIGVCAAVVIGVALLVKAMPEQAVRQNKMLHRVYVWESRLTETPDEKTDDATYLQDHRQEAMANIAIASSNGIGKFPGNSEQRDQLPQAYSDFIFAIIIEETGIWGALFVIALYFWLLVRAGRVAGRCERFFPRFLIMGSALMIVTQAVVNMSVAVGLGPITGQPLPMISRGGNSILVTSVFFGIMLSVSRFARKQPSAEEEAEAKPQPAEKEMQKANGIS